MAKNLDRVWGNHQNVRKEVICDQNWLLPNRKDTYSHYSVHLEHCDATVESHTVAAVLLITLW